MKKEYKAPILSMINVEVESLMQTDSKTHDEQWANSKKSGRTFEDDENIAPAAPKKFWDDEE